MRLLLIRHGETEWNHLNKVLGRTDIPLDETGLAQAEALGKRLSSERIDALYASPLSRCMQTAGEVLKRQSTCQEVIADERLMEMNFGIYEGVSRDDEAYQASKREYFARHPEGESYLDVALRAIPFIKEVIERHADDPNATIAVVTHGGIARVITSYFEDMDNESFAEFAMPNCGVRELIV